MTDLWRRSARDLAAGIASGDFSATEVVQAHLDRMDEVNPRLNAIVRRLDESALAAAAEVDRARTAGEPLGPLAGVPVSVKENIDMVGVPTTQGLVALAEAVSPLDAPVVERMRAAGAIPIGRTNLPDMGLRVHTDNALHGLTRNPWHRDRTTAGSSGGEAAALASGMSALGLGNDLGGSLRNPAGACGIASIKPSLGLVPHAQLIPVDTDTAVFQVFAVQGPMARRVGDVRTALHVLAGPHVRDPFCVPARLAPVPKRLRVAVAAEPPGGTTHPAVAERTRAAAAALAAAGCIVEEVDPPRYADVVANWGDLVGSDVAFGLPLLEPMLSADALAFLRANEAAREPETLESIAVAWMTRQQLMREWSAFFADWDVLLTPTWTQPAFEHGFDVSSPEASLATVELMRPVLPANALGLPSACVSAGLLDDGLPCGVLLTGERFHDDVCLAAAELVEAVLAPATPIDPTWN